MFTDFIDSIMNPPLQFLRMIVQYLSRAALTAAAGVNLSDYVSWIGLLGPQWIRVLNSLLASFTLILVLFVAQRVYRLLLAFKDGIKWW
jgi:hypothetical protein